jgi:hypothetical protein
MSTFGAILLLPTVLLWFALLMTVADINGSDAAGNGMSYSFGTLMAGGLWILLAILMLLAASRGTMPGWVKPAAVVLLPLSLAAAIATINLLYRRGGSESGWPIVVLVIIPLVVIGYAVWATVPSLNLAISAAPFSRIVWGVVLLLSLLPWPLLQARRQRDAVAQETYRADAQASADSAAQALEARFAALTPATPLSDWLAFATAGNDLRERTLAGIRALPDRQAAAEALQGAPVALLMAELRNLDLTATPALCEQSRIFLLAHAESFRARAAVTSRYAIEAESVERYLFAMQWLASQGCDLSAVIDHYETVVRSFPPAPDREQFLARLATLRPPRE